MKRTFKILLLLLLLIIGGRYVILNYLGGPNYQARRHRFNQLVKDTSAHTAIARAAILMMAQTTNEQLYLPMSDDETSRTNLPPTIYDLHPYMLTVGPERTTIELYGGFEHFGFIIEKGAREWSLLEYTENNQHRIREIPFETTNTANQAMHQRPVAGQ